MSVDKLVFMVTHGPDEPELATIPFVMAGAALAADAEVVVGLQGEACRLAVKGVADDVSVAEFAPLAELLDAVREFGGKILVCAPCLEARGIGRENLIDGAEVCAAGRFVAEITSAAHSLVY